MEKNKLTNVLSKVFFTQHGKNKMVCYNGTTIEAKQYLKFSYGVKRTTYSYEYKIDGYLPKGYASIETV